MRVEDNVRKTVVFIGADDRGTFVPYGTGFIGGLTYKEAIYIFLITASHVIDLLPQKFLMRVNRKQGDSASIELGCGLNS